MPHTWPYLLLLLPAIALMWDDFRVREVGVVWLAALCVAAVMAGWLMAGFCSMVFHVAANGCILLLMGGAIALWQVVHRLSFHDVFTRSLGSGDVVMLGALSPLFAPDSYVRFVLAACIAALGWWVVKRPSTLPLAGFMALTLVAYVIYKITGLWN